MEFGVYRTPFLLRHWLLKMVLQLQTQ